MTHEEIIRMALAGKQNLKDRIAYAMSLEREVCAKVCELIAINAGDKRAAECAEAIRTRSQP